MTADQRLSWGRVHRLSHDCARPQSLPALHAALPGLTRRGPILPHGLGRSYGDSCLLDGGTLIDMSALAAIGEVDPRTGEFECEAGASLGAILRERCQPDGDGSAWFLPVTPGTRFVTVGGAIANDVHGKNHHRFGTFGDHVIGFELLRTDGSVIWCSREAEPGLFAATVGGLGLTGIITRARLRLRRVPSLALESQTVRFGSLSEFFALSGESEDDHEYTVAWIDCLASGHALGRGIFTRANHGPAGHRPAGLPPPPAPTLAVPFAPPISPLNRWTLHAFNALYWRKAPSRWRRSIGSYLPALYPLDAIGHWNRLYGSAGFHQYQCVLPPDTARDALTEQLDTVARSGDGSFLVVLKTMGSRPAPGMLSFAMAGVTLALDFPNRGARTLSLLERLDDITEAAGGRIYPAKDGRIDAVRFGRYFPRWPAFQRFRDPGIDSAFARRVASGAAVTARAALAAIA